MDSPIANAEPQLAGAPDDDARPGEERSSPATLAPSFLAAPCVQCRDLKSMGKNQDARKWSWELVPAPEG